MKLKLKEKSIKLISVERKRISGYNVTSIVVKKEEKVRIIQT